MNDEHPGDEFLSAWIDGDLEEERVAVGEHVAGCARCRRAVDELRHIVARAGELEDGAHDDGGWSVLRRRIEAEEGGGDSHGRAGAAARWPA